MNHARLKPAAFQVYPPHPQALDRLREALKKTPLAPVSSFMGLPAMFARAGFVECARPSRSKVIMRCEVE